MIRLATLLSLTFVGFGLLSQDFVFYKTKIDSLWQKNYDFYKQTVYESKFDSYKLYNAQIFLHNVLYYANYNYDYQMFDSLLSVLNIAAQTIDTVDTYNFVYFSDKKDNYLKISDKKYFLWHQKYKNFNESILNSAQFCGMIANTLFYISKIPQSSRTKLMTTFVENFVPILNSHYNRWILGVSVFDPATNKVVYNVGPFQRRGWGCKYKGNYLTRLTHFELLKVISTNKVEKEKYCNAVFDEDLWIIVGVNYLLASARNDSEIASKIENLDFFEKEYSYLALSIALERFSKTYLLDFEGKSREGVVFDEGLWANHSDYRYAAYNDINNFPTFFTEQVVGNISWDLSHARRFINFFISLYETQITNPVVAKAYFSSFSNQFCYDIFNKDFDKPLFTNFIDGANGWFRVGYNNRKNFGFGPYDLSNSVISGGYCLLGNFNNDVGIICNSVLKMLQIDDDKIVSHRVDFYEKYYWTNNPVDNKPYRPHRLNLDLRSIESINNFSATYLLNFLTSLNTRFEGRDKKLSAGKEQVVVFPNPVQNTLKIVSLQTIVSVSVFDASGRFYGKSYYNSQMVEYNFSTFNKGIYFVDIQTESNDFRKIVLK